MDYRYTAITLKKREIGETDRLYTFYTREAGKIQAVARGIRKPEAKLASALETLSLADIMVVRTRGTGKVAGAILEKSYRALRSKYESLSPVLESVKIFETLVDLEEPDETLYHHLENFLSLADALAHQKKNEKVILLVEAFLFQLLNHLGYELQLSRCVVTGEKLVSGGRFGVSPSEGGIVCEKALKNARDAFPMTENAVKTLRLFSTQPLKNMEKLTIDSKDLAQISRFRKLYFQWIRH